MNKSRGLRALIFIYTLYKRHGIIERRLETSPSVLRVIIGISEFTVSRGKTLLTFIYPFHALSRSGTRKPLYTFPSYSVPFVLTNLYCIYLSDIFVSTILHKRNS